MTFFHKLNTSRFSQPFTKTLAVGCLGASLGLCTNAAADSFGGRAPCPPPGSQEISPQAHLLNETFNHVQIMYLINAVETDNSATACQELPGDEQSLFNLVDEMKLEWDNGSQPAGAYQPPKDFFKRVFNCLETARNDGSDTRKQSHYSYVQGAIMGIANDIYGDNASGIRAYKSYKRSVLGDPNFRSGVVAFADTLSATVDSTNRHGTYGAAQSWFGLGTSFKKDLAMVQSAVNALPAADPDKARLLDELAQTALIVQSK